MSLVQLDTGDIAHLEQLQVRDPARFEALVGEWNSNSFELALNLHHAQEIAQLEGDASRERRLRVLRSFKSVRFGGMAEFTVIRQEVAALLEAFGNREPIKLEPLRDFLFPMSSASEFEDYVAHNLTALRAMRTPIEQAVAADKFGPPDRSAKQLKNRKLGPNSSAEAEMRFKQQLDELAIPASERAHALNLFLGIAQSFEGQPNLRAALERHYGIADVQWISKCPDSDLSLAASLVDTARELLVQGRGHVPKTPSEDELIDGIEPYSSPAVRIQFALKRAQRMAGNLEAAHETDRSHAVFAPYVDVAFLDRQTAAFLRQESVRAPNLLPAADLATVCPSGSIEGVVQSVLAMQARTGQASGSRKNV